MDILQKAFDDAVQELGRFATSEKELDALADAIPDQLQDLLGHLPEQILSEIQEMARDGLEERRSTHAAFVSRNFSRWQKGFDQLELLIELAVEAGGSFNERLRPDAAERGDILFDLVVRLHAKGCLIGKEILALLKNGFADGAHARWRALHEISVTAMFLAKHGTAAALCYSDFEFVEAYKGAGQLNHYESRINAFGFNDKEMSEFKSQYDAVLAKHGAHFKKPYGWAAEFLPKGRPTFFALKEDVGLDHWRPYYKWASQNIHANIKSIRSSLGRSETAEDILQVGPSNSGMTDPAHSTAISLLQLTCTTLFLSPNLDDLVAAKVLATLSDQVGESFIECD
ncbi:hypothetical protein SAMN05660653_03172 [Desulfonatronum thiosulfatophilum]|uniref:Uncharacterized protein n=1 Tax=Desulfonatronum thiosulfatophilum TaxID=617002 RepID=A0A1G6EUG6_9BACT|nr:DUF5677 domain-containing protein [Desulfonatronum thiosulfatophilum]SDB61110.1 hypothetical protein SAMN05660653_03172 [Desulfonatronum thiosulfatophilum]